MFLKLFLLWVLIAFSQQAFPQSEKKLLKQIKKLATTLLPESPWSQSPNEDYHYHFDSESILVTYDNKKEKVLAKVSWKDIEAITIGDSASGPELTNFITVKGKTYLKFENSEWKLEALNGSYYSSLRTGDTYDRIATEKFILLLRKMAIKKGAVLSKVS